MVANTGRPWMNRCGGKPIALAGIDDLRQVTTNEDAPSGFCLDVRGVDLERHPCTAAETVQRGLRSGPKDDRVAGNAIVDGEHAGRTLVDEADAPDDSSREQPPAHGLVELVDPNDFPGAHRGCVVIWLLVTSGTHRCDHVAIVTTEPPWTSGHYVIRQRCNRPWLTASISTTVRAQPPGATSDAREETMRAAVGDEIIVKGHHVGDPDRKGEIVAVGNDGQPPFHVRWDDTGHTTLFFPGSDAVVEHLSAPK